MAMIINNNLSALNTQRSLAFSNASMSTSIEKLSSGYKINSAADDPTGLILSEQLRSQVAGLQRAVQNSSEAYNLIGIAEGALNEINTILKNLKSLAIHSANDGITSADQVAADQAEMDSGIQTINRIAQTTKYADQYLLNGAKELVYTNNTEVNETSDHQLLDTSLTRVDQVYKKDGVSVDVAYTGKNGESKTNTANSAQRAYLEVDAANPLCQMSSDGYLTAGQQFTLTGSNGSRQFSFSSGQHIGQVVETINNSSGSTGISATLTFASTVRVDKSVNGCAPVQGLPDYANNTPAIGIPYTEAAGDYTGGSFSDGEYVYSSGDIQIYGADLNNPGESKINSVTITPDAQSVFKVGDNCDGDGKIYAKVVDISTGTLEYYKDKDCTMLIGQGGANYFAATNNSGIPSAPINTLDGIFVDLNKNNAANLDVYEIAVIGQELGNMKDMNVGDMGGWVDLDSSTMSGVNLGVNTSAEGEIYYKYTPETYDDNGEKVLTFRIEAYNNSNMDPKDLVATSGSVNASITDVDDLQTVRLESVTMADGSDSGLNITMNLKSMQTEAGAPISNCAGTVSFTNLGMRVYTNDYGSSETLRITNDEGELFYYYREADSLDRIMVTADETIQLSGQNAKVSLNGSTVYTTGLVANAATSEFSGKLVFNSGKLGETTIAVTGYDSGKVYAKSSSLQGVEENETDIRNKRREFYPQSVTVESESAAGGIYNAAGEPVNFYFDFSNLDESVEKRIGANMTEEQLVDGKIGDYQVSYNYDVDSRKLSLSITDADGNDLVNGLGEVELTVSPDALVTGFTVSTPGLKGLYIKADSPATSVTLDPGEAIASKDIEVGLGNVMLEVGTYATNPRSNTNESLTDFVGGMQFQLGNTDNDHDRTIYSIPSMSMSSLGRINYNGTEYSIQDLMGGGSASLSSDPTLALSVVSQAIDDVTSLRARLGAFQANTLQTNQNSLEVAIENITSTESNIRDTDMAEEATQYTRFQVMTQAGTAMLAQANQTSQNILSLLQ